MNRVLIFLFPFVVFAQTNPPELTAWLINTTGATGYNGIHAEVDSVQYSANNVYFYQIKTPLFSQTRRALLLR